VLEVTPGQKGWWQTGHVGGHVVKRVRFLTISNYVSPSVFAGKHRFEEKSNLLGKV
jgi:hypothetical protein